MKQIPAAWNSDRLFMSDLKESEIFDIQYIVGTSSYVQEWDGRDHEPDYVRTCFEKGDLPPGGRLENYRIQTIRTSKENKSIGVLSLYHGYPKEDSVYLEFLYIHSETQKQGYGQEMMHALTQLFSELGYMEIRINVALKNWPALRFWTKSGFDQISRIYGDLEHSDKTFANMELIKALKTHDI
ncbi:GNAT family N-acetyltransferase [Paenibacillus sp. UMB7766-LJ446]|uniref:GNAT family N-acetyltransferase n=1 Tax=Paenibacillus sp. UMB7766-LJ446 TaxID=3046313 RepID=UPI00254B87BC|nr:GNAT family N-acetyltransferase [Paenibacillus sp. UMB7766-LJ446]MDK8192647.1 GNAT family N-acetyltransferase [Paenibacillus sp. UMB7766-LJ446]